MMRAAIPVDDTNSLEADMATTLELGVIGLSVLAQRQDAQDAVTMFVMPRSHAGAEHRTRLFVGQAEHRDPSAMPRHEDLDGCILRVTHHDWSPGATLPDIPSRLLSISGVMAGATLKPGAVAPRPDPALVHSRIELRIPGALMSIEPDRYEFRTKANAPVRTVDLDRIAIRLGDIDPQQIRVEKIPVADPSARPVPVELPDPAPKAGLVLPIYHVIPEEMPPAPRPDEIKQGDLIPHFEMLYTLFDGITDPLVPYAASPAATIAPQFSLMSRTKGCPTVNG